MSDSSQIAFVKFQPNIANSANVTYIFGRLNLMRATKHFLEPQGTTVSIGWLVNVSPRLGNTAVVGQAHSTEKRPPSAVMESRTTQRGKSRPAAVFATTTPDLGQLRRLPRQAMHCASFSPGTTKNDLLVLVGCSACRLLFFAFVFPRRRCFVTYFYMPC